MAAIGSDRHSGRCHVLKYLVWLVDLTDRDSAFSGPHVWFLHPLVDLDIYYRTNLDVPAAQLS